MLRSFSEHLFYEKLLISCTSCSISTSRCSGELFHRCFSSTVYKNTRSSHPKAFIYLKSLKIICGNYDRLISNEVARCQPAGLRKKVSHIFLHVFCLHSRLLLPKEALKLCEQNFFQEI